MKKYDVTALGELLIDFTENGVSNQSNPYFEANPGGAPCNVLAMLTSLGRQTAFIGKVGDDHLGHFLENILTEIGISTQNLLMDEKIHTTLAFVHTLPDGDRDFSFYRNPGADMMLTEEEIDQFREDPSTLFEGDTDVSLYLRFSSERQREQSIEGQLRDCRAFCKMNRYRIVAIYVDRATTARKDVEKRTHFQEMIRDSDKQPWEAVVVWKLDRFARNRTDSALFKFRLRKNGVRVISATEAISEKPEGIILEAVLEGMAEFYSADLSQKITRGMRESALKCHSIGGHVPLGYKIENHKLVIDPNTAHIVQEAFQLYANGETVADICRLFNFKGYRTAKEVEFNRNSFKSMFRNKRYIGIYTYKDIEIEGGVPAIIDKELFETVHHRLSVNAEAPARGKAKVDYLLAGKLFCGHCGGSMNGESGTSKTGAIHNYYTCYTRKRQHSCDKKPLKKDWIEYIVAQDAMALMTDEVIEELADMAMAQTEQDLKENTRIPELSDRLKEIESGISNITRAIEKGIASDTSWNGLWSWKKTKRKSSVFWQMKKNIYAG